MNRLFQAVPGRRVSLLNYGQGVYIISSMNLYKFLGIKRLLSRSQTDHV